MTALSHLKKKSAVAVNYINRDQSWLAFNERILKCAGASHYPLLERLRFLSIAANNLDEFYMVRLASLYNQSRSGSKELSIDGLTAAEQIPPLLHRGAQQISRMIRKWKSLRQHLRKSAIHVVSPLELTPTDKDDLEAYFLSNIFPFLTPMAIDASHPLPLIPCQGVCFIVQLKSPRGNLPLNALVPLPLNIKRFIKLSGEENRYIIIDHVIQLFLNHLFKKYDVLHHGIFRILRDSEMPQGDDMVDIIGEFEKALRQRLHGNVIQLAVNAHMPDHLRLYVAEQFQVNPNDMLVIDGMLGLTDLTQLITPDHPHLLFPSFSSRVPARIKNLKNDLFEAIKLKDILIHHPFESFSVVVDFIKQAARDPQVLSIKQTLYRTGDNSEIIQALLEAANLGKSVTVLIELKARFDEETNIRWAKSLEDAGVHVVYGLTGLKTHAKISFITRQEETQVRSYVHFGTGNYNTKTAQIYSDLSLLSAHPEICHEAAYLFNYMTGYTNLDDLRHLVIAPFGIRKKLLSLIHQESLNAQKGLPAQICAKMNSLTDKEIIDALYSASQAGVKINLIVRGICSLRPGIPGLSDNIMVKSIVGRFLEHSRIFCFANGEPFPSDACKVYMSSADWMPRNLDWRLEVMVPIINTTVKQQITDQIIFANLTDLYNSWTLKEDGEYILPTNHTEGFNAHNFFLHHPSLSGNGIGPYVISPWIVNLAQEEE